MRTHRVQLSLGRGGRRRQGSFSSARRHGAGLAWWVAVVAGLSAAAGASGLCAIQGPPGTRAAILLGAAVGLAGLAVAAGSWLVRCLSRSLRQMSAAVRRVLAGELGAEVPHAGVGEVRELAGALAELAGALSEERRERSAEVAALAAERGHYRELVAELREECAAVRGLALGVQASVNLLGRRPASRSGEQLARLQEDAGQIVARVGAMLARCGAPRGEGGEVGQDE